MTIPRAVLVALGALLIIALLVLLIDAKTWFAGPHYLSGIN